jgi:hypothetical protein
MPSVYALSPSYLLEFTNKIYTQIRSLLLFKKKKNSEGFKAVSNHVGLFRNSYGGYTGLFRYQLATVALRIRKSPMSFIKYLRLEMKSIATNFIPEVVSYFSYDFKKMLESFPQKASKPLWQPHFSGHPSEGYFSYQ